MADGMTIKEKGLDAALKRLDEKRKAIALAKAKAITRSAMVAKKRLQDEMRKVFDRPTPYTLNAIAVEMATPEKPYARVHVKDQWTSSHYLYHEILGGQRKQKKFEKLFVEAGLMRGNQYLIPWKIKRNQYGNVSPGMIQRVLSGFRAQRDDYANSPAYGQGYRGTRRNRQVPRRYFIREISGKTILCERERVEDRKGALKSNSFTPLFIIRNKAVYRPRLQFYRIIRQSAKETMKANLKRELRRALRHKPA